METARRASESPAGRIGKNSRLVALRDDLTVELCALYNQTGQPERALALVSGRKFQPWEGGEGLALGQHARTHLALGRRRLAAGDASAADSHFRLALGAPENLGEARHLLANASDIWFWLGEASSAQGDRAEAARWWKKAAGFKGDFQEMSVRAFSEMTFFSILSLERLNRKAAARKLAAGLLKYAQKLEKTPAKIDYFATSLPTLLLFEEDPQKRQTTEAMLLQAQAHLALGNRKRARTLALHILTRDPNHTAAADLLTWMP